MRSEYCGLVSRSHLGQTVTLYGWVHRRRDHGGVIFVDLRDREGLVQIVCDPDTPETFAVADKLRGEFVVAGRPDACASGPQGTVNPESRERRDRSARERDRDPERRRCRRRSRWTTSISRRPCGSSTASSICGARRCRRTCACATARRWRCASSSTAKASSTSRRRCSRARRPKARATTSCLRACIRAISSRCRSRRSSSSSCS